LQGQLQNTPFFCSDHLKELRAMKKRKKKKTMKKKKLKVSHNKQTKLPWQGTTMDVQHQTSSSLLESWL
jgi:late competence protein required for DNA uptake (superfamily II DNA/RNA helicase)